MQISQPIMVIKLLGAVFMNRMSKLYKTCISVSGCGWIGEIRFCRFVSATGRKSHGDFRFLGFEIAVPPHFYVGILGAHVVGSLKRWKWKGNFQTTPKILIPIYVGYYSAILSDYIPAYVCTFDRVTNDGPRQLVSVVAEMSKVKQSVINIRKDSQHHASRV